jgi:hypothetical protein
MSITNKLQVVFEQLDTTADVDQATWKRFIDWVSAFQEDINVDDLRGYPNYKRFSDEASLGLPLEYVQQVLDLWYKWCKAIAVDKS